MSGHKSAVVTISQEEYRRLYEAERKSYYEQIAQSNYEKENEFESQVVALATHIQDRQAQFTDLIQNMDEELKIIEEKSSYDFLQNQIVSLNSYIQNIRAEANKTNIDFENREKKLIEKLNSFQDDLEKQSRRFHQSQVQNSLHTSEIGIKARDYLDGAVQLSSIIENSYPGHLINQKEIDLLLERLNMAEQNLRDHAEQAGLSIAQEAYIDLSSIKRNCENQYIQWQLLYNQVFSNIDQFKNEIEKNRRIFSIGKDGKEIGIEIDTDYWSQGGYREIEGNLIKLEKFLQENGEFTSADELRDILSNFLEPTREEYIRCIMNARLSALNSQIRYEIANSVLIALVEQGFKPVTGDYQNGDYLDSYLATAINPSGNRIEIFVDPSPSNEMENSLHVISLDEQIRTSSELRSRGDEIRKSLTRVGLSVESFVEQPATLEINPTQQSQNQEYSTFQRIK